MASPDQSWPVLVYRKTESGWQRMTAKNAQGRDARIKAAPRPACIVLPRVQIRIRLGDRKDDRKGRIEVIRRGSAVLIASDSRLFATTTACFEFCDRLVLLNPSPELQELADDTQLGDLDVLRRDAAVAAIHKILYDEDFLALVDNLEQEIVCSDDGQQILDLLARENKQEDNQQGNS